MADATQWPKEWGAIPLALKDPSTPIAGANATLGDFWRWAYSDLTMNTTRGVLAEYLVARAIDARDEVRDAWATYDLTSAEGVTVEVKSSAFVQSWPQRGPSPVSFTYGAREAIDPATWDYDRKPARHARVYVFALLTCMDQATVDPLDVAQWEFYVVPTWWLDQRKRSQYSITLPSLRGDKDFGLAARFADLGARVAEVAAMPVGSST